MSDVTPASSADQNAAPAPVSALEAALAAGDQAGYSAARAAERAGKPLEPSIPASAAGQPGEQAAETAASEKAASEPADPSGHKGNAETRIQQLLADRARERERAERFERELAAVRQQANAKPASEPAPKADGEPQFADFEADPVKYPDPYAAWVSATAKWEAKQTTEALIQAERDRTAKEAGERELKARTGTMQSRIDAALTADPSLRERILPEQFDAVPTSLLAQGQPASPQNDLAEALLDSEKPTDLMVHLSESPAELTALLASPNPKAFWRELGRIEGRLAAPKKTPAKTVTDAPAPPPTVGTRHESGSTLDVALKTGDQAAYNAERRRQRLAAMRQ